MLARCAPGLRALSLDHCSALLLLSPRARVAPLPHVQTLLVRRPVLLGDAGEPVRNWEVRGFHTLIRHEHLCIEAFSLRF
jgi:hypothetical protein